MSEQLQQQLGEKISLLSKQLQALITSYEQLQQQHAAIQLENETLKKELDLKNEQLKDFQHQFEISKIVEQAGKEGFEWNTLREKIDMYIGQIDQCIGFLSQEP
jgi:regulator of replication initiation timing